MNLTALITGASKRIGKAIAEHLAMAGWNVFIHYNSSKELTIKLAERLAKKYPKQVFKTIGANLNNPDEVEKLIPSIIEQYGSFDLLINNASIFSSGYISKTSVELLDAQLNVNFKAPFILIRDYAKHCVSGNVINFVDTRIVTNRTDFSAYTLSKKMLWELTKMAALEFAPKIRVNAIAPGVTLAPEDKSQVYLDDLAKNIPMKKAGGVEPILKSIDYILDNGHLTGQLLFADGGENLGQNPLN